MTVGTVIGKYRLLREVGEGGMAKVFEAEDQTIGRRVALKLLVIPPAVSEREKCLLLQRFQQEAQAAGVLSHPNIITVYEVGEDGDLHYIAMEMLTGTTLRQLLRHRGRLAADQALSILLQVARALDYAHRQGVIHRDVKPDNIVLTDEGSVKLTDFGIAQVANDLFQTQKGMLFGSPAYMAPEQILGTSVDYRTDLFSLGVTAYEMLTGRLPFEAPTVTAVMHRIVYEEPQPAPELPRAAEAALRRALAKDPRERPASATALVEELITAYYGTAVVPAEARWSPPTPSWHRHEERAPMNRFVSRASRSQSPLWWGIVAVLVVTAVAILAWRLLLPKGEPFGVRIVDVGDSPSTVNTVATNFVLNDFELTASSWQAENPGVRLERVRGGASQAAYWLKASGVQLKPSEQVALFCLPETRDWSRFGGTIAVDVFVPGTAPTDLRATMETEDSQGRLQTMPGEGTTLRPGRWATVSWQAGAVTKDVARLRLKLLCGQQPYRGYFGIDHVRVQGTAPAPSALRYKVRVGPFDDSAALEREMVRLKSLGRSPFPVREGGKRYLQVGAFTTLESARRELDALVAQGYQEVR
ncbi:MAG: protein kinase [Armatimonadota bacterium]|nr:protein kinase [Armatimonadota bacterium]